MAPEVVATDERYLDAAVPAEEPLEVTRRRDAAEATTQDYDAHTRSRGVDRSAVMCISRRCTAGFLE